jgi:hypothetical protein
MEMLRNRAQQLYDAIAGESNIELQIDPVEEPAAQLYDQKPWDAQEVTVHIDKYYNQELSDRMMRGANPPLDPSIENLNWVFKRQGKVKVWIYNISHLSHNLGNGMVKFLKVPACPEDAEYTVVTSLPAVMIQPKDNVDNNCIDYGLFDGRRIAMDLIDPDNMGIDQDSDWSRARTLSSGCNFSMKGVFFSTHNPPLKKELKSAHKRLKKYYTDLMDKANVLVRMSYVVSAAPKLGVAPAEIAAAQQYVQDSLGNK